MISLFILKMELSSSFSQFLGHLVLHHLNDPCSSDATARELVHQMSLGSFFLNSEKVSSRNGEFGTRSEQPPALFRQASTFMVSTTRLLFTSSSSAFSLLSIVLPITPPKFSTRGFSVSSAPEFPLFSPSCFAYVDYTPSVSLTFPV